MSVTEIQEIAKYERVWENPAYRASCHSLNLWDNYRGWFPVSFDTVLDIGCGTGRFMARMLDEGYDAWGIDFASNCLDADVHEQYGRRLAVGNIWNMEWGERHFDLGVCADVMEHMPPDRVDCTLESIFACCDEVLFKIAHVPDVMGGGTLHLSVYPSSWWLARLMSFPGHTEFMGYINRAGYYDSVFRWRKV